MNQRICNLLRGETIVAVRRPRGRGGPEVLVVCSNNSADPDDLLAAIDSALPLDTRTHTIGEEKYSYSQPPFVYAVGRKVLCFGRGARPGDMVVSFCYEVAWRHIGSCPRRFSDFMWLDAAAEGAPYSWACSGRYFTNKSVDAALGSCDRSSTHGATIANTNLGFQTRDEYAKISGVATRAEK